MAAAAAISGQKIYNRSGSDRGFDSPVDAFRKTHGDITVDVLGKDIGNDGNCNTVGGTVTCDQSPDIQNILHEFGHVFDNHFKDVTGALASDDIPWEWNGDEEGYMCPRTPCMAHSDYQFPNLEHGQNEEFADMYMNWVLEGNPAFPQNGFALTTDQASMGNQRSRYMNGDPWWPNYGIPNWLRRMYP